MNIYASTRKGKNKSHSEDRIVINDTVLNDTSIFLEKTAPRIIGISDGVGGNAGGELASQFLCEHALSITENPTPETLSKLNDTLLAYASAIIGRERMAATFSGIVFGETNSLIHIGNTRIYAVQGKYLKQLTNDHTTYHALLLRGFRAEAELCNKSEITACFGGGTAKLFTPDIKEISGFSELIITSDGIHDYTDIDCMEEIICSGKSFPEIADALMQKALSHGSCDDMSILIAKR